MQVSGKHRIIQGAWHNSRPHLARDRIGNSAHSAPNFAPAASWHFGHFMEGPGGEDVS
jgi:hypothetical protein